MSDVRKLYEHSGSTVMSLSREARAEIGAQAGDYVTVERRDGELVVSVVEGL